MGEVKMGEYIDATRTNVQRSTPNAGGAGTTP
jgi:hypothetical protein